MQTPRARILIADDEAHVREVLRHFLTREGYLVSAVEDGRGVLDTVSTFQPDVIVVDMVMPGLTGADVLTALRRAGVTVPIILISAYEMATIGLTIAFTIFSIWGGDKMFDLAKLTLGAFIGSYVQRSVTALRQGAEPSGARG